MTTRMPIYIVLIWVLFVIADFLNRLVETSVASPSLGEYGAHVCSILRLAGFMIILIYFLITTAEAQHYSGTDLFFIGLSWVALTVMFEFLYMHYFRYKAWDAIFIHYNIMQGRLRLFILLIQLLAPMILGIWRSNLVRNTYQDDYRIDRVRPTSTNNIPNSGKNKNGWW